MNNIASAKNAYDYIQKIENKKREEAFLKKEIENSRFLKDFERSLTKEKDFIDPEGNRYQSIKIIDYSITLY